MRGMETTYRINWDSSSAKWAINALKIMGATFDRSTKLWTKTGPVEQLQRNAARDLDECLRLGAVAIVDHS